MQQLAGKMEEPLTDEEADVLLELQQKIITGSDKQVRAMRRWLRYRLFRIREGRVNYNGENLMPIKKKFDAQMEGAMSWEHFTFQWDVHPHDLLTLIVPFEWESAGGTYEIVRERDELGNIKERRICDPSAFTNQEM